MATPYPSSGAGRSIADISQVFERNQEATLYVGNLDLSVDEELLAEVFASCGPLKAVHVPRDKVTGAHSSYGFVEYDTEADADYAIRILNMIKLYGKPMRCNKASQDKRSLEVGANLFVGNLDPEVDDKLLYDTLSSFGAISCAKVMRDPETGEPKGFGFVSFDSFDAADSCVANMNGQFLCNRPIHISYAYKKDTRGERHGSAAERLIAANRPADVTPATSTNMTNLMPPSSATPAACVNEPQNVFPPPMVIMGPGSNHPVPLQPSGGMMPPMQVPPGLPNNMPFPPPPPPNFPIMPGVVPVNMPALPTGTPGQFLPFPPNLGMPTNQWHAH